jgi:DNA-binding response OmpR family regulator
LKSRQVGGAANSIRDCGATAIGVSYIMLKKILIVDDSQAESRLMQSLLQGAGYAAVSLSDPLRIEQMLASEQPKPNLILLDVVMPGRNGFQACRELKNSQEYGSIPIVMVSSKNGESDKFWGLQQGADGYVIKPFTGEELITEVQRVIG